MKKIEEIFQMDYGEERYLKPNKKLNIKEFFGRYIKIRFWDDDDYDGFLVPATLIGYKKGIALLNIYGDEGVESKSGFKEIVLPNNIVIKSDWFNKFKKWELVSKKTTTKQAKTKTKEQSEYLCCSCANNIQKEVKKLLERARNEIQKMY